ncbi:MAG: hypothetical protein Pg6C_14050 [Treponemataceae bacterium]|nr:MAG: hypothetical protein Pg6C_14050 [Treponemataceae bacterium]
MTRIFFRGNRLKPGSRLEGSVLPAALAVILAVSIIMSSWYSLARANYVNAKRTLADYYEKLDEHNAAAPANTSDSGG